MDPILLIQANVLFILLPGFGESFLRVRDVNDASSQVDATQPTAHVGACLHLSNNQIVLLGLFLEHYTR